MGGLNDLVRRATDGDRAAWEALVDQFNGLVWSIARAHRLSTADAADVVQTTWLRLVESLGTIRDPERVGAWLATTARRESLRCLRRAARQLPTEEQHLDVQDADNPGPEAQAVRADRDRMLWEALEHIPPRCQTLLRVLMSVPAPSYESVSAALDMPVGSIGPTRARCLEQLRREVGRWDLGMNGAGA